MALIVVSITCMISSLAYGALFIFVRKNSSKLSKTLRRELHLAIQVLVLLVAFFAILVFYAFLNYFSQFQNNGPVFYMRGLYPMANGFLSYINPFCILVLNKDLTRQIIKSISCFGWNMSDMQMSGIVTNSNKPQTNQMGNAVDGFRRSLFN
ncbi:hypothetical protein CRE_21678 [Caenorhabditis remanei]|uniref:Uncharacterized protein n=1 Tax=Caenorhabditis remanei TaxID=31234 RepID=E3NSS8_CAERE|nr:hypothetical protein CRE_21678 [Caenorhabditis remanei]